MKQCKVAELNKTTSGRIKCWNLENVNYFHLKKASGYFILVMHTFLEEASGPKYHFECQIKNHLLHLMGVLRLPLPSPSNFLVFMSDSCLH